MVRHRFFTHQKPVLLGSFKVDFYTEIQNRRQKGMNKNEKQINIKGKWKQLPKKKKIAAGAVTVVVIAGISGSVILWNHNKSGVPIMGSQAVKEASAEKGVFPKP